MPPRYRPDPRVTRRLREIAAGAAPPPPPPDAPPDPADQPAASLTLSASSAFVARDGAESAMPPAPVGALTAVWANRGDKVHRHDLRRTRAGQAGVQAYANAAWDDAAKRVTVRAGRNELRRFALYLENGGAAPVEGVSVDVGALTGPGGAVLGGGQPLPALPPPSDPEGRGVAADLYENRTVRSYFVRYLKIEGQSMFGYHWYSGPRSAPSRFGGPGRYQPGAPTADDTGMVGDWADLPDANTFYPEIAVPLPFHPSFTVPAGCVQQVETLVYVPKGQAPGTYEGTATVRVGLLPAYTVQVRVEVLAATLPDRPAHKTMVALSHPDIAKRRTSHNYPAGAAETETTERTAIRVHRLFRRLGVTVYSDGEDYDGEPGGPSSPYWRLIGRTTRALIEGAPFRAANNYVGRGQELGHDLFVTGQWAALWGIPASTDDNPRLPEHQAIIHNKTTAIINYLDSVRPGERAAGTLDAVMYIGDEPVADAPEPNRLDYRQIEFTSAAVKANTGAGAQILTFVTAHATQHAAVDMPHVDVFCAGPNSAQGPYGDTARWTQGMQTIRTRGGQVWFYNAYRPGSGSWHTEAPAADIRMKAWSARQLGVRRWFKYLANYWHNWQGNGYTTFANTDLWNNAATYGKWNGYTMTAKFGRQDTRGRGGEYSNGDGVLCYPGYDVYATAPGDNYFAHCAFPSLRLFAWADGVHDADWIALASAAAGAPAVDAVVNGLIGKSIIQYDKTIEAAPQYDGNPGGNSEAPQWPEAYDAYDAALDSLRALALGAVAPLAASLVRHDGLTGTALARGPLLFAPGAVTPAQISQLTAWDAQGAEVPIYVEDVGARHAGDTHALLAYVEAEGTWGSANTHPALTFRFDRPVTGASRRAKAAYSAVQQTPIIGLSADATRFRVTNTGAVHWAYLDGVTRWPVADATFDQFQGNPLAVAQRAGGLRQLRFALAVRQSDNAWFALPLGWSDVGAVERINSNQMPRGWPDGVYQPMAIVGVWLKAGSGTFTAGTTALNDAMVEAVTVTGGAVTPTADYVPTNFPAASVAQTDVAALCGSGFSPWAIESAAATAARGGAYAQVDAKSLDRGDWLYAWRGPTAWTFTNGGNTTYAPSHKNWQDYARTGHLRRLRRALTAWAPWRDAAAGSGAWNDGLNGEAFTDASMAPVHWALTGDPEARQRIAWATDKDEYNQLQQGHAEGNTYSMRWAMHVLQGLFWLHRLGVRDGVGPTLQDNSTADDWQPQHAAAAGTAARWARLGSWLKHWTRAGAAPNAGRSRLWQQDYGGVGPFMAGFLGGWGACCADVLGANADFDFALTETYRYLRDATRAGGGSLFRAASGAGEEFFYSEARALVSDTADMGPELNGCHFAALARLRRIDAANAAQWTALGDALYAAMPGGDAGYFGKQNSEYGLFTAAWPLARAA